MVMERLKVGTQDMHSLAEGRQFQRRMLKGSITRHEYTDWLGQMLLIHRALEKHLLGRLTVDPLFAAVREEQFQEPNLKADLAALGSDTQAVTPLPATAALIADIDRAAAEEPLALLGYHYVLEGSKNGNRFIARQLVPALGLAPRRADRYLDPFAKRPAGQVGRVQGGHDRDRLRRRADRRAGRRRAPHVRGDRGTQRPADGVAGAGLSSRLTRAMKAPVSTRFAASESTATVIIRPPIP